MVVITYSGHGSMVRLMNTLRKAGISFSVHTVYDDPGTATSIDGYEICYLHHDWEERFVVEDKPKEKPFHKFTKPSPWHRKKKR